MKNVVFTGLCFVLAISYCTGQGNNAMLAKQAELMEDISYEYGASLFADDKMYFKTGDAYVLPWQNFSKPTQQQIKMIADTLARYGRLSVTSFSVERLVLESRLPMNMTDVDKIFTITLMSSALKDSVNADIAVDAEPSISFGSKSASGFSDGKEYSNNWRLPRASFAISSAMQGRLKGSVTFQGSLVSDYRFVKITPGDVGKDLVLGDVTLKIIDVIRNKVIVHVTGGKASVSDFKFVNLDKAGKEIVSLSLMEMNTLKKKDKSISMLSTGTGTAKISKLVYDRFKAEPKLSQEAFRKSTHDGFMKALTAQDREAAKAEVFGPEYLVFTTAGSIQNFYLYNAVYELKKEFVVRME